MRKGSKLNRPFQYTVSKFWEKVDKNGPEVHPGLGVCWLWTGCIVQGSCGGYGHFRVGEKLVTAHRFSWFLAFGDTGSLCVLHRCDVRACVRPDHLFLGTKKDNSLDAFCKGRLSDSLKRAQQAGTKLTAQAVAEIRRRRIAGEVRSTIAIDFGISVSQVTNIALGYQWATE